MKLIIEKVDNGYVITDKSDENRKTVIQESEFDYNIYAEAHLLRVINQLMGESTSKYSKHRVYVNVLPGEDYEGEVENRMISDAEFLSYICHRKLEKE